MACIITDGYCVSRKVCWYLACLNTNILDNCWHVSWDLTCVVADRGNIVLLSWWDLSCDILKQ